MTPPSPAPHPISATEPDWSRERLAGGRSPAERLLAAIRGYQAARARGAPRPVRALWVWRWRRASIRTGADIPLSVRIGGGLLLPHPNGIVIHPDVEIGPNCTIFQQVTLGFGSGQGVPRIGGNVDIGAGARLLGPITVGDRARIGANAVVLDDVPAGALAVGVPARIVMPEGR